MDFLGFIIGLIAGAIIVGILIGIYNAVSRYQRDKYTFIANYKAVVHHEISGDRYQILDKNEKELLAVEIDPTSTTIKIEKDGFKVYKGPIENLEPMDEE